MTRLAKKSNRDLHILPYTGCIVQKDALQLITPLLRSSLDIELLTRKPSKQDYGTIANDIAVGLWHLHEAHTIHGDIKPANVLVRCPLCGTLS